MKKIRYGIIGFGAFAERAIMPAIRKTANSELVAIQKRSPDMAKWKAQEYGIPLFFDTAEDLASSTDVDAVLIVSANSRHYPETLIAAERKKHVLVEKPMAMNAREGEEMIDVCKRNNVLLMVGHMLRFSPLLQRMKEIVWSGELGTITYVQSEFIYDAGISHRGWLWDKSIAGGGPLFDIAIHCLDAMRFVLDDTVTNVQSVLRLSESAAAVEKSCLISLRTSRGATCSIYSSFEAPYRRTFIEFVGTKGTISAYDFTPSNLTVVMKKKTGSSGQLEKQQQEHIVIPDLYEREIAHFSDCIINGTIPLIDNLSSLHNQEILDLSLQNSI
jgi:predicted dehydrogenase